MLGQLEAVSALDGISPLVALGPREHAFATPGWMSAWAATFEEQERWLGPMRLLTARDDDGRIGAALPLAVQRAAGTAWLSLGGPYLPVRCGWADPAQRAAAVPALVRALDASRVGVGLRLAPVAREDPLVVALIHALRPRWAIRERMLGRQFVIRLPDSYRAYIAQLGKETRRNIARHLRKLALAGPTELYHHHDLAPDAWRAVIADLADVESRSWIGRESRGRERFSGERNQQFWNLALGDAEISGRTHVWLLRHDGQSVSYQLAVDAGTYRYALATAFDVALKKLAPGSVVVHSMLEQAFDAGIRAVDLGWGRDPYKVSWGAKPEGRIIDYVAFRPTLAGRVVHAAALGRDGLAWLRARLPGPKNKSS